MVIMLVLRLGALNIRCLRVEKRERRLKVVCTISFGGQPALALVRERHRQRNRERCRKRTRETERAQERQRELMRDREGDRERDAERDTGRQREDPISLQESRLDK